MAEAKKKPEPKAAEPTTSPATDDPLADFPSEVEGGHWEYDKDTGDRRWIAEGSK